MTCHNSTGSSFLRERMFFHFLLVTWATFSSTVFGYMVTLYIYPLTRFLLQSYAQIKVTSVWLLLLTGPVQFIVELYIWAPLAYLPALPPPLVHAGFILGLFHPPQHVSQQRQEIQTSISSLSISISPHWPVEESHGYRFHFIQIKYCTKRHTNQITIRAVTLGMQQEKPCAHFQ